MTVNNKEENSEDFCPNEMKMKISLFLYAMNNIRRFPLHLQ